MIWVYNLLCTLVLVTSVWSVYDFTNGANFLSGALGSLITVGLVDRLIARAERQRLEPVRRMATKDLNEILRGVHILIKGVLECVVTLDDLPLTSFKTRRSTLLDRFQPTGFSKSLSLGNQAGGQPRRPLWNEYLTQSASVIDLQITRYVERYVLIIDPQAMEKIHDLQNCNIITLLRRHPQFLFLIASENLPDTMEDLAVKAEAVSKMAKNFSSDSAFPDFGDTLAKEVEEHVRQHPYAESPWFEYRPARPSNIGL